MSIILGNGDALKDLHIGNKIINKVVIGNKVVCQKNWPGLKFKSQQDGSTVGYTINGTINKDIYYSYDGKEWHSWGGSTHILLNKGESIYVWNKTDTLSTSLSNRFQFSMSGSIAASGNINSMINFSDLTPYCYRNMFRNCTSLTTAPDLPATVLADYCYSMMFYGCSNLTTAPELPATVLADSCYDFMFRNCTSLTTAPDLPATVLADYCYSMMFYGCSNLNTATELPATQLANNCYSMMFYGCSNLTTAPDLPATTLVDSCYSWIFKECTRLNSIKLLYTGDFSFDYFDYWVENVSSSGTLYYNGSDTTRGQSAIPQGWTVEQF